MVNSSHLTQTTPKSKLKICNECNQNRKHSDESHQICRVCHKAKSVFIPSGNKVVDDFIRYTLTHCNKNAMKMEFVPYDRFKDVEFIAEGGFSKIYKAIWIDGPISYWDEEEQKYYRRSGKMVALKKLDNSNNINSKNSNELNEIKIFYAFTLKHGAYGDLYYKINKYYGITQDPITKDFMIIMNYYESGNLSNYIANNFFNMSWKNKLTILYYIIKGLYNIHKANITHKDYHSGNIFITRDTQLGDNEAITGDLGISKSAIESDDEDNDIYGIIPYVAPEIFHGQKYTKASDIYSFGMVMWELMTGRRPFWDKIHDTDLIIEICDGLRPPIITNAPEGYIELMQKCWHSDPMKRPTASELYIKIVEFEENEIHTKIIDSPDIGPITTNNSGAIYESRPLSKMIKSAKSRSLNINLVIGKKRKFDYDLIDDEIKIYISKKIKLFNNNVYLTKELWFDIDNGHVVDIIS